MPATIPDSHRDLLLEPILAVLTTMMPDGQPQSSIVWADYDGHHVLINTSLQRQKGRNMRNNPKVTVLVIDPKNDVRWIEVRGQVVEMTEEGAIQHADKLAQLYTGKQRFYGDVLPIERQQLETRVIVRIQPIKVSLDAVFNQSPEITGS